MDRPDTSRGPYVQVDASGEGRSTPRPVFVGIASGGTFAGDRANQPDFLRPYLSAVLGSTGLKTLQFLAVQATAFLDEDEAVVAREQALATIDFKHFAEVACL